MSNIHKVKDLSKFLETILSFVDEDHVQQIRFDAKKFGSEWTVHNFKLETGEHK